MLKPNPLDTLVSVLGYAFKCLTVAIGEIGGICMLVASLILLGTFLGLVCLVVGGLMFYLGRDLALTLQAERNNNNKDDDDDEDPNLPLGTV